MKHVIILFLITAFLFMSGCDNKKAVEESKIITQNEAQKLESLKDSHSKEIDSLAKAIDDLKGHKDNIDKNNAIAEAEIYSIIKKSNFDHIIVGTKDLAKITKLFNMLGFSIKKGTKHKNGILNNFVELLDGSEIELIEVDNPKDNLAAQYKNLIDTDNYGMQFAIRVTNINKLKDNFEKLKSNFSDFQENSFYSTLSTNNINKGFPLFFIQYKNSINNTIAKHANKSKRISSVWFSTKEIKTTAGQLIDLGFDAIGNYKIPNMNGKIVQFKNDNFNVVLIESNKNEISGITILVEDVNAIKNISKLDLDIDFIEQSGVKTKSVFLKPAITKSIWIEFLEAKSSEGVKLL